jgi:uncharacterized protein YjiS (DUF1127 family)
MLFLKSTVSNVFGRLVDAYHHNQRRNESLKSLDRLNDRQLADIGIERRQIEDAVDGRLGTSKSETFQDRQTETQSWADYVLEIAACRTLS